MRACDNRLSNILPLLWLEKCLFSCVAFVLRNQYITTRLKLTANIVLECYSILNILATIIYIGKEDNHIPGEELMFC
jgi:hypothetical protein